MLVSVIVVFAQIICYGFGHHWSYVDQAKWPESCTGELQSPIDLPFKAITAINFHNFRFSRNSLKELKATLTNNGHSIVLKFPNEELTVSGGGLGSKFVLDSFHFHWVSEHTVNNLRYPLEGHFVFYNRNFDNLAKAKGIKGGIAVLGVFYNVSKSPNEAFNFVNEIEKVAHETDRTVELAGPVTLKPFLPENVRNYFRYSGSLTTPNCNEVVLWTIFSEASHISEKQMNALNRIWDGENKPLKENYRKLQERNGRDIYYIDDLSSYL